MADVHTSYPLLTNPPIKGEMNFFRRFHKSRWFLVYALILVATTELFFLALSHTKENIIAVESEKARGLVTAQLDTFRAEIEQALYAKYHLVHEFTAVLLAVPDVSEEQFSLITAQLLAEHTGADQVFVRPGPGMQAINPDTGNGNTHAPNFDDDPEQSRALERAVATGETTFAGPVALDSGKEVFLVNAPVFLPAKAGTEPVLSKIVTLAFEIDDLFEDNSLLDSEAAFDVVIIDHDAETGDEEVIVGDRHILEKSPVVTDLALPGDRWEIAAIPTGGWQEYPDYLPIVVNRFYIYGAAFFILIFLATRFVQQRIRAEKRLIGAIDSLRDGFVYYDENDKLAVCNERYRTMTRLPNKILRPGITFEKLFSESSKRGLYSKIAELEEEKVAERVAIHSGSGGEVVQQTIDGNWIKITDYPVADGGRVSQLIEITDLVVAKENAEAGNRAKSEFLSVISHELRTPLTAVIGYTAFLANPKVLPSVKALQSSLSDPEAQKKLDKALGDITGLAAKIEKSGAHLLALINDTLDLSKIEAGKMEVEISDIAIDPLVRSVIDQFEVAARTKGIEITHEPRGLTVVADKTRLQQILINLVGNAVKFTDAGAIKIEASPNGAFVEFRVSDTGCGIPAADQEKIFERFSQVDASWTRKAGGTGLGLAITSKLVTLLGGQIGVESREGKGSTFWFTLPKATS